MHRKVTGVAVELSHHLRGAQHGERVQEQDPRLGSQHILPFPTCWTAVFASIPIDRIRFPIFILKRGN